MDEIQSPFATDPFPVAAQFPGTRPGQIPKPNCLLDNIYLMRPVGKAMLISSPVLALIGLAGLAQLLNFKRRTNLILLGSAVFSGFGGAYYAHKEYWNDPRFCQIEEDKAIQRILNDNTLLDQLDQEFGSLSERGYLTTERITAAMVDSLASPLPSILDHQYPSLYRLCNDAQRTWVRNNILNPIAQEEDVSDAQAQYEHLRNALTNETNRSDWLKQADLALLRTCLDARSTSYDYTSFRRQHPQPLDELLESVPALKEKLLSNGWLWSLSYEQATIEYRDDLEQLGITQEQLDRAEQILQSEVTTQLDQWQQANPTNPTNEARCLAINEELAVLQAEAQNIAAEKAACKNRIDEIKHDPRSCVNYQDLINLYDDLDELTSEPPSDPEDDLLPEIRNQLQDNNIRSREWLEGLQGQPRNVQVTAIKDAIPEVKKARQKWKRENPVAYEEWKELDKEFFELYDKRSELTKQNQAISERISNLEREYQPLYEQTEEGMREQLVANARACFGKFLEQAWTVASF